jgi:YD repeat-containing protein
MKNIQGNQKSLKLRDKKSRVVYKFKDYGDGNFTEKTYDKFRNVLTYKNSKGYSYRYTRDEFGNVLTHEDSEGFSYKYTRDKLGYALTYKNPEGVIKDYTNI